MWMSAGSFSRALFKVAISPRLGFTRAWHSALLSVHMRTLEFAGAFSSIQLFASCSANISSSVEHVMGLPFAIFVATTLGLSGSPVVMTVEFPPSYSPTLDPSM